MSNISQTVPRSNLSWENASKNHPCKQCGKTDWCSYTDDESVWICRREGPENNRREDKHGVEFWIFGEASERAKASVAAKEKEASAETPCAPVEERDKAYRALLDGLELAPRHKSGLFEEAEALGYRTCPVGPAEERRVALLVRDVMGRDPRDLLAIPGIRLVRDPGPEPGRTITRLAVSSWEGAYVPARDVDGRIIGLMVRRDVEDDGKYVYFRGDNAGSKTGQIPHVPTEARRLREERDLPVESPVDIVRLTEGYKKADVATLHSPIYTVGLPSAGAPQVGWSAIQGLCRGEARSEGRGVVRYAYDSDRRTNRNVLSALIQGIRHAMAFGRTVELETWDPDLGKGIDDVHLGGHGDKIEVLRGAAMYEAIVAWCGSAGRPVPDDISARAVLHGAHESGEVDRVTTEEVYRAVALLGVGLSQDEEVVEALRELASSTKRKTTFEAGIKAAKAALKKEAEEAKAEAMAKEAEAKGVPVFTIGDKAEMAMELVEALGGRGGAVHDEGETYQWNRAKGTWVEAPVPKLRDYVRGFSGAPCGSKPLKVNDTRTPVTMAEDHLYREHFFAKAPAGFGFQNGFVRIDKDGVHIEPMSPKHRTRHVYDFEFDRNAEAPAFLKFLREVLSDEIEYPVEVEEKAALDAETEKKVQYFLEFFGLCLVGKATKYVGKALVMPGEGSNGKSTAVAVMRALFPPGTVSAVTPHDFSNDQKRALLVGKRLNISGETPSKDMGETDLYKAIITGVEMITAKTVYKPVIEFMPMAGHVCLTNDLFTAGDGSHGFFRRHVIMPMTRTYLDHEQDRELLDKLTAEKEGIVRLLLEAAQRAIARGRICSEPICSKREIEKWQDDSSSIRSWLKAMATGTSDWDQMREDTPAERVESLHIEFNSWAKLDNRSGLALRTFEKRLAAAIKDIARADLTKPVEERFFGGPEDALERIAKEGTLRRKVGRRSVRRHPVRLKQEQVEDEIENLLP